MIYRAEHQSAAKDASWRCENHWQDKYPQEAASVCEELDHLLAFYRCEPLHWEYVRTSNPIGKVFREQRRQQFGYGAFANRDACNQVVFRALNWLN
jgi:transposase-like protein